jgi:3-oxoacyl-[acyl-carrier protein] reductase/meso-butanediol dehydrogenase/(S,S)-butanediol dehydrogenase/diacetyl reductase
MAGSRVLVTGAASGMGAATSRLLSAGGWQVTGLDRDEDGLRRLAGEGALSDYRRVDLSVRSEVIDSARGLEVDAVANVAGLAPDARDGRAIWAVNLVAPLLLVRTLAPAMPKGGAVVNVASITGEMADDRHAAVLADPLDDAFLDSLDEALLETTMAYTYSKWALLRHTDQLAVDLAPDVRVNAVSPGIVDTPMGQRSMQFEWTAKTSGRIPAGRLGTPEEIASAIAFLLSDGASYVTGSRLVVDGGYVASRRVKPQR